MKTKRAKKITKKNLIDSYIYRIEKTVEINGWKMALIKLLRLLNE